MKRSGDHRENTETSGVCFRSLLGRGSGVPWGGSRTSAQPLGGQSYDRGGTHVSPSTVRFEADDHDGGFAFQRESIPGDRATEL